MKKAYNPMNETQRLPTLTALNRHWMRCCWIKEMWKNSVKANQFQEIPLPECQGWLKDDRGNYSIDWESDDTLKKIQDNLDF